MQHHDLLGNITESTTYLLIPTELHNQASIVITDYQCNKLSALHILGAADTPVRPKITKRYTLYNTHYTLHNTQNQGTLARCPDYIKTF